MAVPQRTLTWLYSVLCKDHYDPKQTYHDPNRTYQDVANTLAQYPTISPRTDVYTYENGFSALLLHLVGTVPVSFRGTTYRFPVALWIPNTYPREPPMVYVTPTQDMAIRVGQHVTLEGRVYHHYLAHWAESWDRSNISELISVLREVFAKEPPVRYKQPVPPQPQSPQISLRTPPPVPPLPGAAGHPPSQPQSPAYAQGSSRSANLPPQLPPKPNSGTSSASAHPAPTPAPAADHRYQSPPPLPPLPPKGNETLRHSSMGQATAPYSGSRFSQQYSQDQPPPQVPVSSAPAPYYRAGPGGDSVSASPYTPRGPAPTQYSPQQLQPPYAQSPPASAHPLHPVHPAHIPGTQPATSQPTPQPQLQPHPQAARQGHPPPLPVSSAHPPTTAHSHVQVAVPPPKKDAPDLLTSPFEVELPAIAPTGPAPPIPPNPEKDALLHAISHTLVQTLNQHATQSDSAAQSLVAQSRSLQAAMSTLQGEVAALNSLHSALQSNTSILQQALHRADATIADAQTRAAGGHSSSTGSSSTAAGPLDLYSHSQSGLPPIDEVLVAPTVVGKQLYDLVADEEGLQHALYALQSALVRGVIGVDSWSRHTRSLAREAFLKRALIRKIGRGMGLEEGVAGA
ncbi:hypothetical protein N7539_007975 [Penicillium diatomitis]|uniref:Endosomal sorting complex protein TSG101 n=1 Tax=Penicillium diatomitis TaxID=2819901 RepID=A0A9W9WUS9_9EURO|nr:uncharacterized protein N7539_007975 [Penicillium diatomitis]KAJ5475688.1 hypothetical protein N7539_007975 [Penicillium diatomitis]